MFPSRQKRVGLRDLNRHRTRINEEYDENKMETDFTEWVDLRQPFTGGPCDHGFDSVILGEIANF